MPGSEFLEQYGGQSVTDLIALEERYRIDSLVLAFETTDAEARATIGGRDASFST
jgi:hypothetical protein